MDHAVSEMESWVARTLLMRETVVFFGRVNWDMLNFVGKLLFWCLSGCDDLDVEMCIRCFFRWIA